MTATPYALGSRSAGAKDAGLEITLLRQLQEACIEHHIAVVVL